MHALKIGSAGFESRNSYFFHYANNVKHFSL